MPSGSATAAPRWIGTDGSSAGSLYRLAALLDPLLRRSPLVVGPHHRTIHGLQIGDDEPYAEATVRQSATPPSRRRPIAMRSSSPPGRGSFCTRPSPCSSVCP